MTIRLRMYDKFNQPEKSPPAPSSSEDEPKSLRSKNDIVRIFFLFVSMLCIHDAISARLEFVCPAEKFYIGHSRLNGVSFRHEGVCLLHEKRAPHRTVRRRTASRERRAKIPPV